MKKFLVGATSTFALVLGLSTSANALEDDKDYRYRYSIKFICGWYEGDGDWYAAKIVPGYYATAINVYNPHDRNPFYQWNLKFTYPEGEGEWDWDRKNWDDDWGKREAFEIDCGDIYYDPPKDYDHDTYVKGFVYFWSSRPVDISVVYTACPVDSSSDQCDGGVSTMQVQQVEGRKYSSSGWGGDSRY